MIERLTLLLRTTAFRLASIYLALFVLAGAAVALALLWQTGSVLTREALRQLATERDELATVAAVRGLDQLTAVVAARATPGGTALYALTDPDGQVRAGNLALPPSEIRAFSDGGTFRYGRAGASRLAVGLAVPLAGGRTLALARDIDDARALAEQLRRTFLAGLALLTLAGVAGGLLASRQLLGRIEQVTATSRSIMSGDLQRRVPLTGSGDEIDALAASLNAMLDRIEQLMAGMREVSDNIAHDLKTPLNRMRNRIEAALTADTTPDAYRESLENALGEADAIIRTFNALLLIARLEAGAVEESKAEFDVSALVGGIAELYEPLAEEAGLALELACEPALALHGNRHLVGQAIANLIDNAIKYAASGPAAVKGEGRISIRAQRDNSAVAIAIADNGPGIPEHERERALKRFVRLDASRSKPGTGLGLSLVAAVARLHAGTVTLSDNAPGLCVTLSLPGLERDTVLAHTQPGEQRHTERAIEPSVT